MSTSVSSTNWSYIWFPAVLMKECRRSPDIFGALHAFSAKPRIQPDSQTAKTTRQDILPNLNSYLNDWRSLFQCLSSFHSFYSHSHRLLFSDPSHLHSRPLFPTCPDALTRQDRSSKPSKQKTPHLVPVSALNTVGVLGDAVAAKT